MFHVEVPDKMDRKATEEPEDTNGREMRRMGNRLPGFLESRGPVPEGDLP